MRPRQSPPFLLALLPPLAVFALACSRPAAPPPPAESTPPAPSEPVSKATSVPLVAASPDGAEIGKPAPDFTLKDLDGKEHRLSELKGKIVVLEWFNPGCPFVQKSHAKGSLKGAAARHAKDGVVWLAINSGAEGKQGHGVETNRAAVKSFGLSHPVLLDEAGTVGKVFGAKRTPHLFVVDASGVLVYAGAVDNSPDGEGESPTGPTLIRHVDEALKDVREGKPVRTPRTDAYGCSVKYKA